MSKVSHRKKPPLEVNIMFEPHRLQHDLLREAYAYLIPESRQRLSSGKWTSPVRHVRLLEDAERKIA
jgi:hypothetical protein